MTALLVVLGFVLIALVLGIRARRGRDMDLEQWTVGGRGFGSAFVFLLMAGEIYTTFTFLGGSGWAYGKGGPAFYILCYGSIAFTASYWLLPAIWRFAKRRGLHSQSDFFAAKFDSPLLGALVALVGVAALVPYLVLQLKGLGIIVSEVSGQAIPYAWAIILGTLVLAVYVTVSGVHGSAWTSVLKDGLILVVVLALGIYLPWHYFGGIAPMFRAVEAAKPGFLTLPDSGMSPTWFVSTVLLSAMGFYMWPHSFTAAYTARDERVFRRNAIVLPLYQLILLFVFFVGFTAVLVVPGLKGSDGDLSLLRITTKTFDPWFVGVVGGAGVLTALVPGSLILMSSATMLAKNLYRVVRPATSEARTGLLAKALVPVVALIALYFTFNGGDTIVSLLLMGYSLVTQLFPALLLSLAKRRLVTTSGAACGILAGVAVVAVLTLTGVTVGGLAPGLPQPVKDLNVGVVALLVNLLVLGAVTLATRRKEAVRGLPPEPVAAR
ncbi:sodium:solute symporter [Kutzneria viridogrisea]|uniref:SSS family solute:Na+ symporter n=1 Tax=Kutzneria viridogrisea TaxID=47990 RepID=A0ABR6BG54_9PSEU|nr:SSS family solute:Na+ symporter [Kutzneria viridogrisea]